MHLNRLAKAAHYVHSDKPAFSILSAYKQAYTSITGQPQWPTQQKLPSPAFPAYKLADTSFIGPPHGFIGSSPHLRQDNLESQISESCGQMDA